MTAFIPADHPQITPRSKLLWIGVDWDGTLFEAAWSPDNPTSDIGAPIWKNIAKVRELAEANYRIVIHTARPWADYEAIEMTANHYSIPFRQIICGKGLFVAYIDDRAIHSDDSSWLESVLKIEESHS